MPGQGRDPHSEASLQVLRAVLDQAAGEARAAQGELEAMTAKFNTASVRVIDAVGGSAQGVDKQLVRALQEAIRHTSTAVSALCAVWSSTRVGA